MAKPKKAKGAAAGHKVIALNKNAKRLYVIHETIEAGIVLSGTEVKSLREGTVNMGDSYAYCKKGEAFLSNMNIGVYKHGNRENHAPTRVRKLLLHKSEILRLDSQINKKGKTIVPTRLYFKKGRVKVEIGIGTGKKLHDKRQSTKDKEVNRDMARAVKRS